MAEPNSSVRRTVGIAVVALAVLTVATAAVLPAFVDARPANQIPVANKGEAGDLASPTGEDWNSPPAVDVPLASAPSGLPNAESVSVDHAEVKAARGDGKLFVRVSWPDATADSDGTGPRDFVDAVAVQVPVDPDARPPIAMGNTRNAVNVWYWSADTGTEELLAGGPGSTTEYDQRAVTANATHADGEWHVVFARDLTTPGPNRTQFRMTTDVDVAFAVWNGSNMERSGRKAVSEWYHFPLGPGPAGPPYATILWSIAGIAIAVIVAVTALAVGRT